MGILSRRLKQTQKEKGFMRSLDLVKQVNLFKEKAGEVGNFTTSSLNRKIKEYNKAAKKNSACEIASSKYNETMKLIDEPELGHIFYKTNKEMIGNGYIN